MPIQTEDIKLLKSQVMADTSDGGGAMTGNEVVDGVSNNLFPDTSSVDRALGRVNIRQIYGVAHTNDTDVALGVHTIITDAPDDPLVHCTLMAAPRWGANRDEYREAIERYLVKGPLLDCFAYEAHYAGSLSLRLFSDSAAELPVGGDAVVIRNTDGTKEQYIRVLRVTNSAVKKGKKEFQIGLCTLGQALAFDFAGESASEENSPSHKNATGFYTTTVSGGAKFYGIKPTAIAAAIGDYSVVTNGGIFAPLVPAATVESPLVDQYPLLLRRGLSRTALRALNLPAVTSVWNAGATLSTPTAIEPGSFNLTHGGVSFTDDGAGNLKQGATVVGNVSYKGRTAQLSTGAPSYGSGTSAITYRPATQAGAGTHSAAQEVTIANQGLVYTFAFEPPPAPGTFTLSYMAQGRWYVLEDNGSGKLTGSDTSYGIGTISYATGSIGVTLGAIPDIGSALVYQWGTADAAIAYSAALPAKLATVIELPYSVSAASLTLTWSRGATNYAASCNSSGVLAGDATGTAKVVARRAGGDLSNWLSGNVAGALYYVFEVSFEPNVFPDGAVVAAWQQRPNSYGDAVNNGGGSYTLGRAPAAGSVSLSVLTLPEGNFDIPTAVNATDNGAGALVSTTLGSVGQVVATVNYSTGAVTVVTNLSMSVYERTSVTAQVGAIGGTVPVTYESRVLRVGKNVTLQNAGLTSISHSAGVVAPGTGLSVTPTNWTAKLQIAAGLAMQDSDLAFECGNSVYYGLANVLAKGWKAGTGLPDVENCGNATSTGAITVTSLPSNGVNSLSFANAAVNKSGDLRVSQGVFRVASAPLKAGVFQLQSVAQVAQANGAGVISGGGFTGLVDYARGIVTWGRLTGGFLANMVQADALSYNAVFLQYLPLDSSLLGLETARLPLDGRVPIFRAGGLVVVHNTQTYAVPNPLTKGTAYNIGRSRLASVKIKTATGVTVSSALYTTNLDTGTVTVPAGSDISALPQPWSLEHRIEDLVVCSEADISGKLKFTRALTHAFPAGTSFVSSALVAGDAFGRVYNVFDQATWTGAWSDALIGAGTLASYNTIDYPPITTNRGAVKERWALIFTSNTAFRVVGENYGEVGTGNINTLCQPNNTATGVPFFSIPVLGWGGGWSAGNVLRINTDACGTAIGVVRTVLQGPDTLASDKFTLALRLDVNA
jgi:hypothetical protein